MPGGFYNFECGTCGREFPSGWESRDQHCDATGHRRPRYECHTCERWFNSDDARVQHMRAVNHFRHECSICTRTFPTEAEQEQHEHDRHFYCAYCERTFQSRNNLDMHLKSRTHLGTNIVCPFCGAGHATATGLTHHLERGSCPRAPNIDRESLYRLVRSRDPNGVLTKKLIGWNGNFTSTYEATDMAWNGDAYECYLCHRDFNSLRGLNQHLASPAHQQSLYHCPKAACPKEFTTLGALINHLESETCGAVRFDKIQSNIGNLIRNGRLLT